MINFKDARVTGKVKWFNVKIKYGFVHWYFISFDSYFNTIGF